MLKPTDKVSFGLRGYNGVRHNNLINLPPQRFVPLSFVRSRRVLTPLNANR